MASPHPVPRLFPPTTAYPVLFMPRHGRPARRGGPQLDALGATTVSNDLVFTTLYSGVLMALNHNTGAIVYEHKLPTSANTPIAIAGNSILVPAGGPNVFGAKGGSPQVVAYTVQ